MYKEVEIKTYLNNYSILEFFNNNNFFIIYHNIFFNIQPYFIIPKILILTPFNKIILFKTKIKFSIKVRIHFI
jgi:hypothetical protein